MPQPESPAATRLSPSSAVPARSLRPQSRRNLVLHGIARVSMAMGPASGALYDTQIRCGGGVRCIDRRLQLAKYPVDAPPLRLGFISDLHYGATSGSLAARQAWQYLRRANLDVLLLGGDFLFGDGRGLPSLVRALQYWQKHPPRGGIYACIGNHDFPWRADGGAIYQALLTCLEACGVKILVNTALRLPEPWNDVWLAGVDDYTRGEPSLEAALAPVPQGACTIMLSHSPEVCGAPLQQRCAFTLCGHTHGGQICRPGGKPLHVASAWSRRYHAGLHRHAGNWVFVSRGVGTVVVPLRLWAPPDVAVFELAGRGTV